MSSTNTPSSSSSTLKTKSDSEKKSPHEYEPRYSKLSTEQKKRLFRHVAEIQHQEQEMGLQQKGPSLG